MKKQAYLAELEKQLSALPEQDRRDALNYYEEYFEAAGAENEEKTAAELGSPAEAARKILEGEGLTTPELQTSVTPKNKAKNVWIVLIAVTVILLAVLVFWLTYRGTGAEKASASPEATVVAEPQAETSENPAATGMPTAESAAKAGSSPTTVQTNFARAKARDMTLMIDYGTVTVKTSDTVTEAVLLCENVRTDWLTFDGEKQVRIAYKTPVNYNLSDDPEPHFTLTVPTARSFTFQKLNITAVMGDVVFDGELTADTVTLNLDMGNFSGGTVTADAFTARMDMGVFELDKLNGAQTTDVEVSMGDVGFSVDGSTDEYSIDIKSDMGDTAFNGQVYPGGYLYQKENARVLMVKTSMGDAVVTTEKP